jgi:hypothetical protein
VGEHVCVCISMCFCVCVSIHVCISVHTCVHVVCVHTHACMCLYEVVTVKTGSLSHLIVVSDLLLNVTAAPSVPKSYPCFYPITTTSLSPYRYHSCPSPPHCETTRSVTNYTYYTYCNITKVYIYMVNTVMQTVQYCKIDFIKLFFMLP